MTDEEKTREQIEEIVNNNNEETVNDEPVKEEIKEEAIKPKAKAKSRAKAKQVKIVKEPVEQVVEEPVDEEKPKKIDKLKEIVKCPDCNMDMTVHTLKYIHKRRGLCKADVKEEPEKTPEPPEPKPKITQDIVND